MMLSKMSKRNNVLLNWYFSMKKMIKIPMIFDIENWLWKSNFGTFWHQFKIMYDKLNLLDLRVLELIYVSSGQRPLNVPMNLLEGWLFSISKIAGLTCRTSPISPLISFLSTL